MYANRSGSTYRTISAIALAAVLFAFAFAGAASANGGRPLFAIMLGSNEVAPGDPDGYGSAVFFLNSGKGTICYEYSVADIATTFTGAHIHRAPAGINGPVVVPLMTPDPATGLAAGCRDVDPALVKEIRKNPAGFYINVHNTDYPAGAIRGQLEKPVD